MSRPNAKKGARVDLGLALLHRRLKPGETASQETIAAWAGCSKANIYQIERKAKKEVKRKLKKQGFKIEI